MSAQKNRNRDLVAKYVDENPECEFGKHFDQFPKSDAHHTHHIFGGNAGRKDLLSNIIRLSADAHDWCHRFPSQGRVLAIYVKHLKGEMDLDEFKQCSGMHLAGWLHKNELESHSVWARKYLEELWEAYP